MKFKNQWYAQIIRYQCHIQRVFTDISVWVPKGFAVFTKRRFLGETGIQRKSVYNIFKYIYIYKYLI